MSDLRKAAEMALEVFDGPVLKDATEHAMRLRKACDLLRQALAESVNSTISVVESKVPIQPEQERRWVEITYDEVYEFVCTTDSYINLARAIEAKLKEKNGG